MKNRERKQKQKKATNFFLTMFVVSNQSAFKDAFNSQN